MRALNAQALRVARCRPTQARHRSCCSRSVWSHRRVSSPNTHRRSITTTQCPPLKEGRFSDITRAWATRMGALTRRTCRMAVGYTSVGMAVVLGRCLRCLSSTHGLGLLHFRTNGASILHRPRYARFVSTARPHKVESSPPRSLYIYIATVCRQMVCSGLRLFCRRVRCEYTWLT